MNDPKNQPVWARQLGLLSVVSGLLISYMGAGVGLGYFLWKKFGFPFMTLVITGLVGLAMAMYRIYQVAKKESSR